MKANFRKFKGGGKLALILLAVALLIGFANATWVHQVITTQGGSAIDNFYPTVDGAHYHQAVAPASGDIVSRLRRLTSPPTPINEIARADGVCERKGVTLRTTWSEQCQLESWCDVLNYGTGQAWVADVNNVNLPSCTGQ